RAAALTDQLLQFSRKRPPEVRRVDLNRTVANLLSMLGRVIGGDVAVRPRLASDLHPIAASESGLEQVLMNLVVNARDAMPRGGTLTVRTENVAVGAEAAGKRPEARAGSFVLLSVEDTGVGMPDETLQHLFEPFFTTKKPGAGTGLGLSVVYGIVRQHGGWIDVSSEPGKGSAFRVYLPAAPGTADEPGGGESPAPASTAPGGRILFVEDDPSIRDFAEKALRRAGYSVRTCASAAEAQDAFEASGGAFDLILSDMIMPGRGGADLAVALWARQPGLRVVLTSGYTTEGLPASPEGSPLPVFLRKPYSYQDLLRAIRKAMEGDGRRGP
ncbi:MAG: ATP-binding protein, partial [Planctomycetes bacterium]|nr:ATP-binding protein [Planctomycetota bacterium]